MKLTYVGEVGRVYPALAVSPEPGQSYELKADPQDGRWAPEGTGEAQPPQVLAALAPETTQPPAAETPPPTVTPPAEVPAAVAPEPSPLSPMPTTETETEATTP